MNDFTKEELEYLLENVEYDIEECHAQNPAYSVKDKLQSMIDNHKIQESCEHNWEFEFNDHHCLKCELRK